MDIICTRSIRFEGRKAIAVTLEAVSSALDSSRETRVLKHVLSKCERWAS